MSPYGSPGHGPDASPGAGGLAPVMELEGPSPGKVGGSQNRLSFVVRPLDQQASSAVGSPRASTEAPEVRDDSVG